MPLLDHFRPPLSRFHLWHAFHNAWATYLSADLNSLLPPGYYAAPNVQQPKFRWISVGAAVAILVWISASALFGFYVANFGSYNKTYGALAGVIVFLLWLWITNLALLFGAELDAELERGRQLQAGIAAERDLQLPPRDDRVSKKNEAKEQGDVERGRRLRRSHGKDS